MVDNIDAADIMGTDFLQKAARLFEVCHCERNLVISGKEVMSHHFSKLGGKSSRLEV